MTRLHIGDFEVTLSRVRAIEDRSMRSQTDAGSRKMAEVL